MDRLARHPAVEPGGRLSDPDAGPGRTAALAVYRDPARPARPQRARMAFRHRDLDAGHGLAPVRRTKRHAAPSRLRRDRRGDRKSVVWGKSVSVRVDLGGRRSIKKKQADHNPQQSERFIYKSHTMLQKIY